MCIVIQTLESNLDIQSYGPIKRPLKGTQLRKEESPEKRSFYETSQKYWFGIGILFLKIFSRFSSFCF